MVTNGYHGKILHIDLSELAFWVEEPGEEFYRLYIGGALLGAYYLLKLTPARTKPLSSENLLIFASSVVAGYPAAGLPRFSVCTKSPLTSGIGEGRCEGPWAIALKESGFDAVVCHGVADRPVSVLIDSGMVSFRDARPLWGTTTGTATDQLQEVFGPNSHVAAIGPAGENKVRFASIVTDRTHQVGRSGVGAVMGSKNLKAIVLRGGSLPPLAKSDVVATMTEAFGRRIKENPLSLWQKDPPGFAVWVHTHGLDASLDVNNYRNEDFPFSENYRPSEFLKFYHGIASCPGCPNDCIKIFHVPEMTDLDSRAGGIHQEITGAMGPNIGMTDIKNILRANNMVNQLGMDPTSLGFTLSFAMELVATGILQPADCDGLDLRFGNSEAALEMTNRIAYRKGLGDILAEGSRIAAQRIGRGASRFALHVKGLEMVPFEPRSQTNLAMGFAISPTGPRYDICEHDWDFDTKVGWPHTLNLSRTLGILQRIPMDYLGPEKVRNFKALNNLYSAADTFGFCIFAVAPTRVLSIRDMATMVEAITGWESSSYEVLRVGERRNHLLRVYNLREGLTAADDILPDRFYDEPIAAGPHAGRMLDRTRFREMVRLYYEAMGWDNEGIPSAATLYDHHLDWTIADLPARENAG